MKGVPVLYVSRGELKMSNVSILSLNFGERERKKEKTVLKVCESGTETFV